MPFKISEISQENLPTFVYPKIFAKYLCTICMETFAEPVRFLCNHHMCKHCLTSYVATQANPSQVKCPTCRLLTPASKIQPDKYFEKIILALPVNSHSLMESSRNAFLTIFRKSNLGSFLRCRRELARFRKIPHR
jgi:hypothetical protein